MGQLVQNGYRAALNQGLNGARAENVVVTVGDAAGVLHGACVELRHKDLVVLFEGVGGAKQLLEVLKASLGQVEDFLAVHVLSQGAAAVGAQLNLAAIASYVGVGSTHIGAGHNRSHIRRERTSGGKVEGVGARLLSYRGGGGGVRKYRPALRGLNGESERSLKVRLLENRENAAAVGHLKLAVKVGEPISGVNKAV